MIDYRACFEGVMFNQTGSSACTAVALSRLVYFNTRSAGVRPILFSPLYIYYNTRIIMGTLGEDSGSEDDAAIRALEEFGVCPEADWPFDPDNIPKRPTDKCYEFARRHPLRVRHRTIGTIDDVMNGLMEQRLTWCVMTHYAVQSIDPDTNRLATDFGSDRMDISHSLLVVGATDNDELIIMNSYGRRGGVDGFFLVSIDDFRRLVVAMYQIDTDIVGMDRNDAHMLRASYDLVVAMTGSVDDSHNHRHSEEALFWSTEIVRSLGIGGFDDIRMIGHCAILHDMIDSKYNVPGAERAIVSHLGRIGMSDRVIRVLTDIMKSMSYHLTIHEGGARFPEWDCEEVWTVYHVVREADLLTSFNIARMIEFGRNRRGVSDPERLSGDAVAMFAERMDKLIDKGAFILAGDMARSLQWVCRMRLPIVGRAVREDHLDILRIVNYLDITSLIDAMVVEIDRRRPTYYLPS